MTALAQGTLCVIHNTTATELDGQVVEICGISSTSSGTYFYIVRLAKPLPTGYTHRVLIDSCLELL